MEAYRDFCERQVARVGLVLRECTVAIRLKYLTDNKYNREERICMGNGFPRLPSPSLKLLCRGTADPTFDPTRTYIVLHASLSQTPDTGILGRSKDTDKPILFVSV